MKYGDTVRFKMPLLLLNDEEVVLKIEARVHQTAGFQEPDEVELERVLEGSEELGCDDPIILDNLDRIETRVREVFYLLCRVGSKKDFHLDWYQEQEEQWQAERLMYLLAA